jgi:hypothetical protein
MSMLFPKTAKTAMEEALTMSAGFPRDQFSDPLVLARAVERIEDRETKVDIENDYPKKSIGLGVLAVVGIIGYLVFRK